MTYPYPVYRDNDHLYTICRDGPGYAITMIPMAEGLGGAGHVIVTPQTRQLSGALAYLRDMARQTRMQKCPANAATLDRGRNANHQEYNTPSPKAQPVMRPGNRRIV